MTHIHSATKWLAWGTLLGLTAVAATAGPLRLEPGLVSIRVYEQSGPVTTSTFGLNSAEVTAQLAGNLTSVNRDFAGIPNEYYDIFYSDANGTFNLDGEFISIEGSYTGSGSGFNISEVELVFGGSTQFATSLESYVAGSSNFLMANLANILDGDINTSTAMGQTSASQRMRVTVGFAAQNAPVPEPSTCVLGAAGLAALAFVRHRRLA